MKLIKYLKIKIVELNSILFLTEDMIEDNTFLKIQTINNSLKKLEQEGMIEIEYNKTTNINLIEAIERQDYDTINKFFEDNI